MAVFRIAATADAEIRRILARSLALFGPQARTRYAVLIDAAMADIAENPASPLPTWKTLSLGRIGIYHLAHSRDRVPDPPGRVGEPRHALVFRVARDGAVDFVGVVHDSMLRTRALRRSLAANPDLS
jgi:toxin ParE1/3/4